MKPRAEAKASGRTTYVSGRPCPRGHNAERYTSSGKCVECAKSEVRERTRAGYYKALYQERGDEVRQRAKSWYADHRERALANIRGWQEANPEKRRAIVHAYKARRRAQEASGISTAELAEWTAAQKKVCYWCGCSCAKGFHIDHYVPLARGGKHDRANLVIACGPCNRRKSARDPYEFAAQVGRLL